MTRKRQLPQGWYPSDAAGTRELCRSFLAGHDAPRVYCSVVVPHAGWGFSGKLACRTIAQLRGGLRTVVVVGGHLGASDPILLAPEDAVETPLGDLEVDRELATAIRESLDARTDRHADNTVEVQLPFVASLFPGARIVYVRCPPSGLATQLGELVASYAANETGVAVIGSTDLTHYGPAYGFAGHGTGETALEWVKRTNDARFVDALVSGDPDTIVSTARSDRSACSAGGAAAAAAYARASGCTDARVIDYYTSYDVAPNDSFVGYVGVGYRRSG